MTIPPRDLPPFRPPPGPRPELLFESHRPGRGSGKLGQTMPRGSRASRRTAEHAHPGGGGRDRSLTYQFRNQTRPDNGRYRVGCYTPGTDDRTKWVCLDFDAGKGEKSFPARERHGGGPAGARDRRQRRLAVATFRTFRRRPWLAPLDFLRSAGGRGEGARLGLQLVPDGILLASGEPANPRKNRGIEVFPKKGAFNGGPGNMVWLPWWRVCRAWWGTSSTV